MTRSILPMLSAALLVLVACGGDPKPPPKSSNETVAANSLSEERLKGNENPSAPKPVEKKEDPTQAMVTSMGANNGNTPAEKPEKPSGKKGAAEKDEPPPPSGKGGGAKVGRAECDQIWDKGISLEIESNPALKGAGPEVAQMAKQMAAQKHGPAPCDATQKQYSCAMAATTTARWKQCLK